jgi:hypothetical protein
MFKRVDQMVEDFDKDKGHGAVITTYLTEGLM